ncbi:TPA: hypothetical protein HA265_00475 [Candidatus Woesearchaeota archaeon]|nr:hypothetical protein [Candidatus Woesearchaeota archaeon]
MSSVEDVIRKTLSVNMGYKKGEKVLIVQQDWHEGLPEDSKGGFTRSSEVTQAMHQTLAGDGVDVVLMSYDPEKAMHGQDAVPALYKRVEDEGPFAVVFMPTAFSLSHTPFRKWLTEQQARIASMPTFTMTMFQPGGPMDADYEAIARSVDDVVAKMRDAGYVQVGGLGTDMLVEVPADPALIHGDTGLLVRPGDFGNLPAGEAYCVPVLGPKTKGYFTARKGWGGAKPTEHDVRFTVKDGLITEVCAVAPEGAEYVEKNIASLVFGGERYNVLAELGIGANLSITAEYVRKNGWSTLVGEKIVNTVHFAHGNSAGMGGTNNVPIHVDWVIPDVNKTYIPRRKV